MGLFGLFAKPDPVVKHARQFAKLLVNYRRKHPDRPLYEAIKPALPVLRMLVAPKQHQLLEMITSAEYQVNSVPEMCSALVAVVNNISPDASEQYQHVVLTVQAELQSLGYVETA